jgi:alanine-synthesizing transaminase
MLCTALLNAGDEVLLPSPNYSLWSNSVILADAVPVYYRCDESAGWYPDPEDMRAKITPRTRAILVINPNNPTGAVYPREVLEQIVALARENGLILISDEIYDRLVMDGKEHVSTASLAPDLFCVTLNGLSKSHSVCGFRCGWMCLSGAVEKGEDVLDGVVQLAAMRLCSNALTQVVIPAALADEETPRAMVIPGGRLYEQREAAASVLAKIDGISFVKNSGAFYMFPRLSKEKYNITDDRRFARDLLLAKHILIVPGSGFDYPEPDHFRLVLLPEAPVLKKAMEDLGDFLSDYHQ